MKSNKDQKDLFLAELDILQQTRVIIKNELWADNPLLSHYEDLSRNYEELLRQSIKLLYKLDDQDHVARMRKLALAMAHQMQLDKQQMEDLDMLVLMHDIGKVAIPSEVLQKTGPLDHMEWELIKKHCEIAYRMARAISENQLADNILAHHEHWDGSGYPQGLKGYEIPLAARMMAVIDAYDVMTHGAAYKMAIPIPDAIAELQRCSGTQFDPAIIKVFIEFVEDVHNE